MNEYQEIYDGTAASAPERTLPKERPVYTGTERVTAAVMLLLGFLWVRLGLYHANGIFTTLADAAILTVTLIFLRRNGVAFTRSEKLTIGVLYVFTLVYTVTANTLLKGLNTVFLLLVGGLFLLHTANPCGDILRFLPVSVAKGCLAAPFRNASAAPLAVTSGAKSGHFWKNIGYAALGLLLAVPVTGIAGILLYSADEGMANLMDSILDIPSKEIVLLFPHALIGMFLGMLAFSAMYTATHKGISIDPEACGTAAKNCRVMPVVMLYAMVTPLCLLYLLFFFTQLQYFLGGFTGETNGLLYSEYARRGFFELCGVCCMNLFVVGGMGFFAKREGKRPLTLRIFGTFLSFSSLLLAGTAIAKMFLYIRVYGMTQLRIYTTWFMLLLMVFFALLLVRQWRETLNLGKIMSVAFTLLFALLCFSRPDAWMTRYNADRYLAGNLENFDNLVLYEMSDDAWAALTAYDDETIAVLLRNRNENRPYANPLTTFEDKTSGIYFSDFWKTTNLSAWELLLHH